ncbi:MAG: histidine triad nucleotide-binding protein [Clostridiales bacterium]|nr:histidine triad nucleotide-binding protein [Clostridiales bacterium]
MADCIFCLLASHKIPTDIVYEDDTVFAFNDMEPQAPVHILIIPKEHIESVAALNENNSGVVAHIFEVAAKIAREKGLDSGFRIVTNTGDDAGQSVKHLHFHLLGGRSFAWPAG